MPKNGYIVVILTKKGSKKWSRIQCFYISAHRGPPTSFSINLQRRYSCSFLRRVRAVFDSFAKLHAWPLFSLFFVRNTTIYMKNHRKMTLFWTFSKPIKSEKSSTKWNNKVDEKFDLAFGRSKSGTGISQNWTEKSYRNIFDRPNGGWKCHKMQEVLLSRNIFREVLCCEYFALFSYF